MTLVVHLLANQNANYVRQLQEHTLRPFLHHRLVVVRSRARASLKLILLKFIEKQQYRIVEDEYIGRLQVCTVHTYAV
jgi:hypothetical protein